MPSQPAPAIPSHAANRDLPNLGIAALIVILCLYSVWIGWQAMHGDDSLIPAVVAPVATTATPPKLKLNQSHQRLGAEIKVDPAAIGKQDPFSQ